MQWPHWFTIGNLEIKLRFARSGLGPLWSSLSFAFVITALAAVYSRILGLEWRAYAPYLTLGLLVWTLIASIFQEASDVFVHAAHTLKQVYLPRTSFLYRLMWRNLVLFTMNAAVAAVVLALSHAGLGTTALLAVPGMAILLVNLFWVSLLLALGGARFWAFGRAVQTVLPIAMLVTPILWHPHGDLSALARWNPFWYGVEIVRAPLLGETPVLRVWIVAIAAAVFGSLISLLVFARWRDRIPYWI